MATLEVQDLSEAGLEPEYDSADVAGDVFADDGTQRTFLHVKNGGGDPITVTVTAQETERPVPGMGIMTKADLEVEVPAGEERMIGPFAPDAFKTASGTVEVEYSAVTSVTVAAIRVPQLSA